MNNKLIIILFTVTLVNCSFKSGKIKDELKEVSVSQALYQEEQVSNVLQKKNLLGGKLMVELPNNFDLMSKEMLASKYPESNRPTIVYTNKEGSINFAFNHTFNDIPKDKLPKVLPVFVGQFNSIYPQIKWFKKEVEKINGKDFVILEFITPAIDSKIYNIMYVTVLEGRMLMCSFNCLEYQRNEWEAKAKKSLNSVVINE